MYPAENDLPAPPLPALGSIALLLDVDGTLVEFAETPQAVTADSALRDLLLRLRLGAGRAFALVSGRSLNALDHLFIPLKFDAAGVHGAEWRVAGVRNALPPPPAMFTEVAADLHAFAAAHPGVLVEDKGAALAVHTRAVPHLTELARTEIKAGLERLGDGYRLQCGSAVVELVPVEATKGAVIGRLMARPPFAGRWPVFAGDDLTDETGFAAVGDMGGFGVLVGPPRVTAARYRLPSVDALRSWLERLAGQEPSSFGRRQER